MAEPEAAHQAWELCFALFRRHRAHMRALQRRFDLAPMDMHSLRALVPGEPMAVGQLAERIFCDPPNIVKVVARLHARGLLTRMRDATDARVRQVRLTQSGERLRTQVVEALVAPPPYITNLTPADQQALRDILTRIQSTALSAHELQPHPPHTGD